MQLDCLALCSFAARHILSCLLRMVYTLAIILAWLSQRMITQVEGSEDATEDEC